MSIGKSYPDPRDCFVEAIAKWEGEFQANPADAGNWIMCDGRRKLVGTMRGVTPATLAAHLAIRACDLDADEMRRLVTVDLAAEIGVDRFYRGPGFDTLTWSPLVWIAVDIGWGSGPVRAVKMLQELVGAAVDGVIGPQTRTAYERFLSRVPIADACDRLSAARRRFYLRISEPGTPNHIFRRGWLRRADYYTTTGNGVDPRPWWPQWAGWTPLPAGDPVGAPVDLIEVDGTWKRPDDDRPSAVLPSVGRVTIEGVRAADEDDEDDEDDDLDRGAQLIAIAESLVDVIEAFATAVRSCHEVVDRIGPIAERVDRQAAELIAAAKQLAE